MKQITHITTFLQGGAGKIICDLAEDQIKQGYSVTCITNDSSYQNYFNYPKYENKLKQIGVNLLKIDELFKRELNGLKQASFSIKKFLEQTKVDIIHSHSAIPSKVVMMALEYINKEIPIINTMHGWGMNKSNVQEIDDLFTLSKVNKVVSVSKTSKRILVSKGIKEDHVSVIYNGIEDLEKLNNIQSENFINSLKNDAFVIGCIGTICDRKNQALIVQATEELINHNKNIYCVFIGEDNNTYSHKLKRQIIKIGLTDNIRLLGYLDKAEQYITNFDLFVLPTKSEGLPLSIIEAFKASTIVVTSNVAECSELVKHNYSGLIFDLNSSLNLTATIKKAMTLDISIKEKIIDNAYSLYQNKFTQEKMLTKYNELYRSLIYT